MASGNAIEQSGSQSAQRDQQQHLERAAVSELLFALRGSVSNSTPSASTSAAAPSAAGSASELEPLEEHQVELEEAAAPEAAAEQTPASTGSGGADAVRLPLDVLHSVLAPTLLQDVRTLSRQTVNAKSLVKSRASSRASRQTNEQAARARDVGNALRTVEA